MMVVATVRGARRPGAPSVEYRADTKRGNHVRNLRGTSSAAARKFCGVTDAGRPSAAARERSPPGDRARWAHARLMPGSTQSTAAVLPRVQGRSPGGFPPAFDIKSGAPAGQAAQQNSTPSSTLMDLMRARDLPKRPAALGTRTPFRAGATELPQRRGFGPRAKTLVRRGRRPASRGPVESLANQPGAMGRLSRTPRRPPHSWT